jgi:hypothetical protein
MDAFTRASDMMTNPTSNVSAAAIILCAWLVMPAQPASAGQPAATDEIPVLKPPVKVLSLHRPTADWNVVTSIVLSIEPTTEPKT